MLDIQGQPSAVAQPAVAEPVPQSKPGASIPSITGSTTKLTIWTAVFVVVLVLIAGAYLSFVLTEKQALVATQKREVDALTTQLGTPDRVKTEALANQFKKGVNALQPVLTTPSPWSTFLKDVTTHTPKSVVLNNLSTTDGLNFRVSGSATTYLDLAQFMTALQSSSNFSGVELESGTQSVSTTGTSVTFSLKATYVPAKTVAAFTLTPGSTIGGSNGAK